MEEKKVDLRGEDRRADESLEDCLRTVVMEALELEGARMVVADVEGEEVPYFVGKGLCVGTLGAKFQIWTRAL